MKKKDLVTLAQAALEDMKAEKIAVVSVKKLTVLFDDIIVATARSQKHLDSVAEQVELTLKAQGHMPLGVVGRGTDWAIVDLGAVVVHVMLPNARDLYQLEKFWTEFSAVA